MGKAKSNITVAIESKLLKKARAVAARRGRSVSALLAEELHDLVAEDAAYEAARLNAQALLKSGFSLKGTKMIDREEAHDRRGLR
jgi:hypothetical protein